MIIYKINGNEITSTESETGKTETVRAMTREEEQRVLESWVNNIADVELASWAFQGKGLNPEVVKCYRIIWDYVLREANNMEADMLATGLCIDFANHLRGSALAGGDITSDMIENYWE